MKPVFKYFEKPALEPNPDCPWAKTMVLNPAIIKDLETETIHMLFRSTGPSGEQRMEGSPYDPYPIYLGYAKSEDGGCTWEADFSRPALAPLVKYKIEELYITDSEGEKTVNYTNGCIEDPRIFSVEGELYVSAACRMFPPGPYWLEEKDVGMTHTNTPEWTKIKENPLGNAAYKNATVSVLYKLDLNKLKEKDYENAFQYICNLTDGSVDDNRDVFLFPNKMNINGKMQYVLVHRPHNPENFAAGKGYTKPSIMLAAAENIKDLRTEKATHHFLASILFDWEEERIGGSWSPIQLSDNEWILPYHGKQYPGYGYSQSFMILRKEDEGFPRVVHRCPDRLMYAERTWELPDKFACPCLFTTGGIVIEDTLIMSYGAADQKAGISKVNFHDLIQYIRLFDENGKRI